ncbi:MAG: hypothetical protein GWO24_10795 [Akkermansiaceae bacterium]|nr:hypothetical protein [Akkermansiaceae bacterium]
MGILVLAASIVVLLQVQWMNKNKDRFNKGASLQAFTRIIQSQTIRIYCDYCSGSGIVRDPADPETIDICPLCFGPGLHFVRQMNYGDLLCPDCSGMGRLAGRAYNEGSMCLKCDGRGVVQVDVERLKVPVQQARCPECGGRGVLRAEDDQTRLEMCQICYGLGTRTVRKLNGQDDFCPGCLGMGRLVDAETEEARWCKRCAGRGLVVSEYPREEAEASHR